MNAGLHDLSKKIYLRKIFFWKYWEKKVPGKTEYPENHENSETFFPESFLKLNSLQVHVKKISPLTYEDLSCPEAYHKDKRIGYCFWRKFHAN